MTWTSFSLHRISIVGALLCGCDAQGEPADTRDTTDTAGPDSTSDNPGPHCASIQPDEGEAVPLSIVIRNERSEPIFLRNDVACGQRAFEIEAPDGGTLSLQHGVCDAVFCDAVPLQSKSARFRCGACPQTVVRLDPGASLIDTWSGVYWESTEIPSSCAPELAGTTCDRRRLPPAGTYVVRAVASSTCVDGQGAPCTTACEGDPCEFTGSELGASELTMADSVTLPGAEAIELIFAD